MCRDHRDLPSFPSRRSSDLELGQRGPRLSRLAGLSERALGIAHEIKNPLNGVAGFAGLLERSNDQAASRRYAGKVVEGVRQVDEIGKSRLDFARPHRRRGSRGRRARRTRPHR